MYDDPTYPGPYDYPYDEAPLLDETVHLCPECRDLMSRVVRVVEAMPRPEPEPDWSCALRWLDGICGGRPSVLALDAAPLTDLTGPTSSGQEPTDVEAERLEATAATLDTLAADLFSPEARVAFRRGLRRAHERQPGLVMAARSVEVLAHGVVWTVGHANGLLWPIGSVKEKDLRLALGTTQAGSTFGARVERALAGPYDWDSTPRPWRYGGSGGSRDLKALGHADLLVSGLRQQLVEVRDRALSAAAAARGDAA